MLFMATHPNDRVRSGVTGETSFTAGSLKTEQCGIRARGGTGRRAPAQTRVPDAGMQVQLLPSAPSMLGLVDYGLVPCRER